MRVIASICRRLYVRMRIARQAHQRRRSPMTLAAAAAYMRTKKLVNATNRGSSRTRPRRVDHCQRDERVGGRCHRSSSRSPLRKRLEVPATVASPGSRTGRRPRQAPRSCPRRAVSSTSGSQPSAARSFCANTLTRGKRTTGAGSVIARRSNSRTSDVSLDLRQRHDGPVPHERIAESPMSCRAARVVERRTRSVSA